MNPMDPQNDPFWKMAQQGQQQQAQRAQQIMQGWAQNEQLIQKRVGNYLTYGIPLTLWKRSRTALFVYVLPFWCFIALFVCFGLREMSISRDNPDAGAGQFFFAIGCFFCFLWIAFTFCGFLMAVPATKIIAAIHVLAFSYFGYLIWNRTYGGADRNVADPIGALALITMVACFLLTVIIDLVRGFRSRPQTME